jgi:Mn2+/Fe2+ NRAMP family transporter
MEAGEALHGILGNNARIVWAIGLLAAGQSSTMTGLIISFLSTNHQIYLIKFCHG